MVCYSEKVTEKKGRDVTEVEIVSSRILRIKFKFAKLLGVCSCRV